MISLVPFPSEVSAPWRIQVVDTENRPVPACRAIESWAWWPLDTTFQSETRNADANGYVSFSRRTKWASPTSRLLGRLSATASFHGGRYGPQTNLYAVSTKPPTSGTSFDGTVMFDAHTPGVIERDGILNYRALMLPAADRDRLTGKAPPVLPPPP